jgi:Glycosyl hydrolases family 2/Glycosyl hydrolases family 2, sugar binding domain
LSTNRIPEDHFVQIRRIERRRAVCTLGILLTVAVSSLAWAEPVRLGGWTLRTDPEGTLTTATLPSDGWRAAKDGRSWNAQFEDLRDYFGVAWYRASFRVSASRRPQRVLLRFGAVDYAADVFVNGGRVGSHEGAYTPFTIDVTDQAKPGANDLLVRVVDPPPTAPGAAPRFPDMPYEELPRGKQNWYIENGGLWQPVVLDIRPEMYIDRVHVTQVITGQVALDVDLAGVRPRRPATLQAEVRDPNGRVVATLAAVAVPGPRRVRLAGVVQSPQLWSPATPVLYTASVKLSGSVSDEVSERIGFRTFTTRDGQFFLNGEPFYMRAALDQDFYPESIYSTPDKAYVVDQMRKGRALGLNLLRCHIKVCDPTYLEAADETGMLVWYEVPSWDKWTTASVARGQAIFDAMVARDWNHPSIVIQSLINEAWGIDMTRADQRAGLAEWFRAAKALTAPLGRLIVDNSPCCDNFHVTSDIDDFHQYYSIPDNADRWDRWVNDFATRPAWTFSPHGDAQRTGQEPLVVSEFGNWGLPDLPAELPWWFPRDFDGRAITRPAGLFERFKAFGFDRVFHDYRALAHEAQWRQFQSLKHEIETIRRHEAIRGYVITEFTDINWEANGLMNMWRQPKIYGELLAYVQQDDVLLPSVDHTSANAGETVKVSVDLSRYGSTDPAGGVLRWTAGERRGEIPVTALMPRAGVDHVGDFDLELPAVTAPTRLRVGFELFAAGGALVARNVQDVFVYPPPSAAPQQVVLHDPYGALTALPWKNGPLAAGVVVVSATLDAEVRQFVEAGGRALIVPRGVLFTFAATPGLSAVARRGELDGNWVSNFPWVNPKSPPFAAVAVGPISGGEAAAATPRYLLSGVSPAAWQSGDVLAGEFFGWLNDNHAVTAQFTLGNGKVIVSTFDVAAYGHDPFTTRLVNGLIQYLGSDSCQPKTRLD